MLDGVSEEQASAHTIVFEDKTCLMEEVSCGLTDMS